MGREITFCPRMELFASWLHAITYNFPSNHLMPGFLKGNLVLFSDYTWDPGIGQMRLEYFQGRGGSSERA